LLLPIFPIGSVLGGISSAPFSASTKASLICLRDSRNCLGRALDRVPEFSAGYSRASLRSLGKVLEAEVPTSGDVVWIQPLQDTRRQRVRIATQHEIRDGGHNAARLRRSRLWRLRRRRLRLRTA
jgi:hypothetical protein